MPWRRHRLRLRRFLPQNSQSSSCRDPAAATFRQRHLRLWKPTCGSVRSPSRISASMRKDSRALHVAAGSASLWLISRRTFPARWANVARASLRQCHPCSTLGAQNCIDIPRGVVFRSGATRPSSTLSKPTRSFSAPIIAIKTSLPHSIAALMPSLAPPEISLMKLSLMPMQTILKENYPIRPWSRQYCCVTIGRRMVSTEHDVS
jgi:hypothetical protein